MRIGILFLLVALLFARVAEGAPRYIVDSWQTDEGLPQNSVISISQSPEGYLWLATFNGLVRFDGARFTVFNAHNTPALDSSRIVRLWHDRGGALWIGAESGSVIRYFGGVFERLPVSGAFQLTGLCDGPAADEVWLARGSGGLHRYLQGRVESVSTPMSEYFMTPFFEEGRLHVFTDRGVIARHGVDFIAPTEEGLKHPNSGDVLIAAAKGGWWRTHQGRVRRFVKDAVAVDLDSDWVPARIASLYEDRQENLWIGTLGGGAVRIDASGEKELVGESYGLGHAHVRAIFEDREGNIWLGTDGAGLHRLRRGVFEVVDKSSGLGAEVALAVAEDEEGLWVGTNGGGLTHLTRKGAQTFFPPGRHVWTLLPDGDSLWVGTWGSGLFRMKGTNFQAVPELAGLREIVVASHRAADGTSWFGGPYGLASWKSGQARVYTTADGLSTNDVRAIIDDGEGGLWIGTNGGGLNRLKNGRFSAIRRSDGLADDVVWALHRDSENNLWIGGFGRGLSVLRAGKVKKFSTSDGLPSNVICSINEDDAGVLWISSYNGVFSVRRKSLLEHGPGAGKIEATQYTRNEGLPSRECTGGFQPSACKTRDGRFVFTTVKGIAFLDPKKIPGNPVAPPVMIEEAEINGVVRLLSANPEPLVIEPNARQVQFRYTALSFNAPEKIAFRYKLEPLDDDWQEAGNRRAAYYPHLPAGEYEFRVIASNNDGVWNRTGATLAVRVVPAIWQRTWFRGLCILALAAGIFGAVRYVEIGKFHRRMEVLEHQNAIERERARIARDIHDDLGASLTQITLLSELARGDLPRPSEAESHLRGISGTARELTRAMDEIVWAINPQNDTLEDLLTYAVKFAQEHLKLAGIRCRVDAPASLPSFHLGAEIRHNLFLAIKEAINNVAKHSQASEACLRLVVEKERFAFEIEDDGKGLNSAGQDGSRNGLRNMERRLREIGGGFELRRGPKGGTIVRLTAPILASMP